MESLSDIETELRTLSQSSKYCELQPTVSGKPISFYFAEIADRIKAVAPTTEKSSAVGNAAAMCKALKDVLEKIDRWRTDGVMEHWQYSQLFDIADSALAAPPRQCDVGTAEEQNIRFERYCRTNKIGIGCEKCPLLSAPSCELAWAQMPYEAQEGGAQ